MGNLARKATPKLGNVQSELPPILLSALESPNAILDDHRTTSLPIIIHREDDVVTSRPKNIRTRLAFACRAALVSASAPKMIGF